MFEHGLHDMDTSIQYIDAICGCMIKQMSVMTPMSVFVMILHDDVDDEAEGCT